jgi:alpha-tubulin suppressor-like RCC1 family protein
MHACVLAGGAVKCWGYDNAGQLGNGVSSSTSSATPVDVTGLASGVAQLGAGYSHTCALLTNGNLMCWGDNVRGELGDGTVITRHAPVAVVGF